MSVSSSSVQFKNKNAVLEAFANRDIKAWSVWQGKQFMFKGVGLDELEPVIEALASGGTNAIYTLKVYEDLTDKKFIKNNTVDDGSFNFRLNDERQEITNAQYWNNNNRENILEKLNRIEERLDAEEKDTYEKPNTSLGRIGDILQHPAILPIVPVLVEKVLSVILGPNNNNMQPQLNYKPAVSLAGVNENDNLIQINIEKLKNHDPNLGVHLSKLVEIAETNPGLFQTIVNSLV
jgi:hypothetical protein